jgi:hypothetical protein
MQAYSGYDLTPKQVMDKLGSPLYDLDRKCCGCGQMKFRGNLVSDGHWACDDCWGNASAAARSYTVGEVSNEFYTRWKVELVRRVNCKDSH